jgi:hypothetical protein
MKLAAGRGNPTGVPQALAKAREPLYTLDHGDR